MTRDRAPSRRAGMTMLEVMVAILILTVAVYILSSTVTASITHTIAKQEKTAAVEAAMNKLEELRAAEFADLWRLYNSSSADDPYGPGTGPGSEFDVAELDAVQGGNGPLPIGEVLLPGVADQLIETAVQPEFGLPRDLNGDLFLSIVDCADDYIILPVTVRVTWQGRSGARSFELSTMLVDLAKL